MSTPESITITHAEIAATGFCGTSGTPARIREYAESLHAPAAARILCLIADKLTPPVPEPDPDRLWPIVKAATTRGVLVSLWRRENRTGDWVSYNGYPPRRFSDLYDVEIVFEGVQQ